MQTCPSTDNLLSVYHLREVDYTQKFLQTDSLPTLLTL